MSLKTRLARLAHTLRVREIVRCGHLAPMHRGMWIATESTDGKFIAGELEEVERESRDVWRLVLIGSLGFEQAWPVHVSTPVTLGRP